MSRIEEAMRQAGRKMPAVPSGNTDGSLEAFPVTSTASDSTPVVDYQVRATTPAVTIQTDQHRPTRQRPRSSSRSIFRAATERGPPHFRKITSIGYHEMFLECVAPLSTTDFSSFGTATGTRQPGRFPTLLTTDDWY